MTILMCLRQCRQVQHREFRNAAQAALATAKLGLSLDGGGDTPIKIVRLRIARVSSDFFVVLKSIPETPRSAGALVGSWR